MSTSSQHPSSQSFGFPSVGNPNAGAQADSLLLGLKASSPEVRAETLRKLSRLDQVIGITPIVVAMAGESNSDVCMWAAEVLERSIVPSADETSELVQQLQSSNGEVIYWAASMIGRLGEKASDAAISLTQCLENSSHLPAKEKVVWALCQIGPDASVARDALRRVAEQPQPRLARLASEALKRLDD